MEFLELAKERYSCRDFSTKQIEQEKIEKILEAARLAPTARNLQPQRLLIITQQEQLKKLSSFTQYGWNAPLVLLVFYDKSISYKRDKYDNKEFGDIDASIVTTHIMFEAQSLGLRSTWIGSFDPEKLVQTLAVPKNLVPVSIIAIGYPSAISQPSKLHFQRNEISDFVYWNHF